MDLALIERTVNRNYQKMKMVKIFIGEGYTKLYLDEKYQKLCFNKLKL